MRMRAIIFTAGIVTGTVFASFVAIAWTGPAGPPPDNNVAAPVNVGSTDQTKNGALGVNGLAVFGNTLLSGSNRYLNWGTTVGANGYGIRDSSGTLQFKNSGGSWNSFNTTVQNYLSVGAVTQVKFSDGTTQSTAASGSSVASGTWCGVALDGGGDDCHTNRVACMGDNNICDGCPSGYTLTDVGYRFTCTKN